MDPDRDISSKLSEILKQRPQADSRPPDGEPRIRLLIAFYAVIAAFSMAVFFYGASRLAAHIRTQTERCEIAQFG